MSQAGVGSTRVVSHKIVGGLVRHLMDTAGHQRFSGPSKEGRGYGSFIANALILMSDWCGFVPTPYKREPGCGEVLNSGKDELLINGEPQPVGGDVLPLDTGTSNERPGRPPTEREKATRRQDPDSAILRFSSQSQ